MQVCDAGVRCRCAVCDVYVYICGEGVVQVCGV